jgi:3-methyladenine DNA glycosylase/8-oxoguanine DNA glycosylase
MFGLENFFNGGGNAEDTSEKAEEPMNEWKKKYMDTEVEKARKMGAYVPGETEKNLSRVYDLKHANDPVETQEEKESRLADIKEQMKRIEEKHPELNLPEAEIRRQAVEAAARSITSGERGSRTPDHIN